MENTNFDREQEIPGGLLARLIEWMREHGHSEKEIVDCILFICNSKKEISK